MNHKQEETESSNTAPETLEERFARLRKEGMSDDDIIRDVFTENINTPVSEICRITGKKVLDVGRIKGPMVRWMKKEAPPDEELSPELEPVSISKTTGEARYPIKRETPIPTPTSIPTPISAEPEEMSPREFVAMYGEEAVEKLKRQRLVNLLKIAPGISSKAIEWIMNQYDLDENARRDPNALMALLQSSGSIKENVAYRIVSALTALEDEFEDILRRQAPPFYSRRRGGDARFAPFPTRQRTDDPRFSPRNPYFEESGYASPGYQGDYYRPPSLEEMLERLAEKIRKKDDAAQPPQAQQVVTVTEPLRDGEGKLVLDKDGNPVYRKIVGPMGQVGIGVQEDPELRALRKAKEWKSVLAPENPPLTEETVRRLINEGGGKKESLTKEDLEKMSSDAATKALTTKDALDAQERRHQEIIQAIKEGGGSKTTEGYKGDEFRLLGQTLDTLAKREPKTARVIADLVRDILSIEGGPPSKEIEAGASESVIDRIPKEYVVEE